MDWTTIARDGGGWAIAIAMIVVIVRSGTREPPLWVLGREYRRLQEDLDRETQENAANIARLEDMQQEERQRLREEIERLRQTPVTTGGSP